MKKHQQYEGIVEKCKFPNKGIVKIQDEEESVMVKNTLPGQKILFTLTKNKTGKKEGRLDEVLQPANIENGKPFCPHFEECGGCAYQTMDYEGQKQFKLEQVQNLLRPVYPEIPLTECVSSPLEKQYRNKMEFSFGDEEKNGPLTLGMHKKNRFYDIVDVDHCQIVHGDLRTILTVTRQYFAKEDIPYLHKMNHEGYLRHLMVRRGENSGEILVCLVTTSQMDVNLKPYKELLLEQTYEGKITGILHIINDSLADVVQADEIETLYGQDYFYETILGLDFKITPFSFFQTNSLGAEELYSVAREYIGELNDKVVFDLYSGTGTIAQVLAPVAKEVIGVEIVAEAVVAAGENAVHNGLSNCRFIAGDVLKVIGDVEEKPDTIVLDPPREGIHPKALQHILSYGVERMVYISCKPTSLAKDMEAFLEAGYRPVKAKCVDMFPWTRGIETVVLFENGPKK